MRGSLASTSDMSTTTSSPNILVIMADQLRRHSLSIYGDPNISTPNIDALATSGVRFSQASSTFPVCVPARFTFMTGQYAHSRFVSSIEWRMSPAETTLADHFNAAGYETCYIGKWHLYGGHGVLPGHTNIKANRTPVPRVHQGRWKKWYGFDLANAPWDTCYYEDDDPTPRPIEGYQTDGLTDLAVDYLQDQQDESSPFCCVLSVEPPHFPMEAPAELEEKWKQRKIQLPDNFLYQDEFPPPKGNPTSEKDREAILRHVQLYYAMVENLDQNVGRVMEKLRQTGQDKNTIVMFFADHGEMQGAHSQVAALKHHPYEESVGIPLIFRDPRQPERQGIDLTTPTCMEDIVPTLVGLAGLDSAQDLPGADLSALIQGSADELARPGVMLEYVHDFRQFGSMCYHHEFWRAFRSERYKYTVKGGADGGTPWQFFDLQEDPQEMKNLVASALHEDLVRTHHGWLRDRMLETDDHFVLLPAFGFDGVNEWEPQAKPLAVGV